MKKEHGTLEQCLDKTIHHGRDGMAELLAACGCLTIKDVQYRFSLMRKNTEAALKQVVKIRRAATKNGCTEVLKLLNAKTLQFGHDWSKTG